MGNACGYKLNDPKLFSIFKKYIIVKKDIKIVH